MQKSPELPNALIDATAKQLSDLLMTMIAIEMNFKDPHYPFWQIGLPKEICECDSYYYYNIGHGLFACRFCDKHYIDLYYHNYLAAGILPYEYHGDCHRTFITRISCTKLYICHTCGKTFYLTKHFEGIWKKIEESEQERMADWIEVTKNEPD